MNHDKVWRLQCGHTFHAQCWDRVVHGHVDRQLAGNMESSASEAPPALSAGVLASLLPSSTAPLLEIR
eukprot:6297924-Pyramimonas_sp.AAC.1